MSADDARKLFVGGLSDSATEDELRAVFADAGFSVAHLAVPRDRETGRLRGFAFVTLSTEEEAEAARRKLQGVQCGGRTLNVREFSQGAPKGPSRNRGDEPTVFLGKLPFDATQEEINQFFAQRGLGPVVRVTLPSGPDGRPRGFGFATLETPEAASEAVEKLNGAALRGRSVVVSPAQPRGRAASPGPGKTRPSGAPHGASGTSRSGNTEPHYEVRGPRAVPKEPDPTSFFPEDVPLPPPEEGEGRRRKAEPRKKERHERRRGDQHQRSGRRRRGGAGSWQQWESDED